MSLRLSILVPALLLAGAVARADTPAPDVIAARLYPPELIMGHQQELGIDGKQREAIVKEVQALQNKVVDIQWQMQAAVEELGKLLEPERVDEQKALAQADRVMAFEREVKRAHLTMLIRIRNVLTDVQRAKLAALRARPQPEGKP
jgi:Spy/CpxP family protein refolding chaperone